VVLIPKECQWGPYRERRCRGLWVYMHAEQHLGNEMIGETIVGEEDDFFVSSVLAPGSFFHQHTFHNQPTI
jgi:hypothetical protein